MQIGVLGLTTLSDPEPDAGLGPTPLRLLTVLVAQVGRVVPSETLMDLIWSSERPRTAQVSLRNHIVKIRRVVDVAGASIEFSGGGYRLNPGDLRFDHLQFEEEIATAARQVKAHRFDLAERELTAALSRWRGEPFQSIDDLDDAVADLRVLRTRACEARCRGRELLAECRLATGDHAEALVLANELESEMPASERLARIRILALDGLDRRNEAFEEFARIERILDDEFGAAPGPSLVQALETVDGRRITARAENHPLLRHLQGASAPRRFVGRRSEIDRLLAVARGRSDRRLVAVEGPPGIGKTRLLAEAASELLTESVEVYFGGADYVATPFGAVTALLDHAASRSARPDHPLSDGGAAQRTGPADQYFETIRSWLRHLPKPNVAVIDDLQWADPDSMSFLRWLCGRADLGVDAIVVAFRNTGVESAHPIERLLANLERDGRVERLALEPLSHSQTGELIDDVADVQPLDRDRISDRAEGLPLYAIQLAVSVADARDDGQALPTSLQGLFEDQLVGHAPAERAVLDYAALLGAEASLDELLRLGGAASVDRCLDSGLLTEVGRGSVALVHGLYAEYLTATLRPGRKREMHRAIADLLRGDASAVGLDRRARHLEGAIPLVPVDDVIGAYVEAAAAAESFAAFERSVESRQAALALHAQAGQASRWHESDLLVGLGLSLAHLDEQASEQSFFEGVRLKAETGDLAGFVEAVASRKTRNLQPDEEWVKWTNHVFDRRDELSLRDQARLAARMARDLAETDHGRAVELSRLAAALQPEDDDPATVAMVLQAELATSYPSLRPTERLPILQRLSVLASELSDDDLGLQVLAFRAADALAAGNLSDAREQRRRINNEAVRLVWPRYELFAEAFTATMSQMEGDDVAFEEALSRLTAISRQAELTEGLVMRAGLVGAQHLHRGELESLTDIWGAWVAEGSEVPVFRCAFAAALAHGGDRREAHSQLSPLAERGFGEVGRGMLGLTALAYAAEAVIEGRLEGFVEQLFAVLEPHQGLQVISGAGIGYLGPVDGALGRLALLRGDDTTAGKLLQRAASDLERFGAPSALGPIRRALEALEA